MRARVDRRPTGTFALGKLGKERAMAFMRQYRVTMGQFHGHTQGLVLDDLKAAVAHVHANHRDPTLALETDVLNTNGAETTAALEQRMRDWRTTVDGAPMACVHAPTVQQTLEVPNGYTVLMNKINDELRPPNPNGRSPDDLNLYESLICNPVIGDPTANAAYRYELASRFYRGGEVKLIASFIGKPVPGGAGNFTRDTANNWFGRNVAQAAITALNGGAAAGPKAVNGQANVDYFFLLCAVVCRLCAAGATAADVGAEVDHVFNLLRAVHQAVDAEKGAVFHSMGVVGKNVGRIQSASQTLCKLARPATVGRADLLCCTGYPTAERGARIASQFGEGINSHKLLVTNPAEVDYTMRVLFNCLELMKSADPDGNVWAAFSPEIIMALNKIISGKWSLFRAALVRNAPILRLSGDNQFHIV